MKVHIGCGRHVLDGWVNVDTQRSPKAARAPDVIGDALSIPLPDGCASEVMAIHLLEHLAAWQVPKALAEWHRLLKPGGLLVLEMPDVVKCAKNLVKLIEKGDEKTLNSQAMHGLYGDPSMEDPWMLHRWGWTPKTLIPVLKRAGFGLFKERPTQWHGIGKAHRDFRIESRKV
jgi:SAM-dependent methyltransferase